MKRVIILWSPDNNMGFGVEVDEKDVDKAKNLAADGYERWFCPEKYPEYHDVGLADPAMELLDEAGIVYRILDEDEITDPDNGDYFNMKLNPIIYDGAFYSFR